MRQFQEPFLPNHCYHVFNRAVGSEKMFREADNYHYFSLKMQQYILPVADIFCYNFLPNHFHLFVRIKPAAEIELIFNKLKPQELRRKYEGNRSAFISEQFGNWCNAYTKAFNKKYDRKGKLFMDSLNRKLIHTDDYFSKIIHYIHANAVQHGISSEIKDWRYSSFIELSHPGTTWLAKESVWERFGGLEGFLDFHNQPIRRK